MRLLLALSTYIDIRHMPCVSPVDPLGWARTNVDHHIAKEDQVCALCTLAEAKSKTHFLFQMPHILQD